MYYRLNVVPIPIPPLRSRKSDIPPLIDHFLRESNKRHKRHVTISKEALDILLKYNWPGNVRELENLIEQLVIMSETSRILPQNLPMYINVDEKLACSNHRPPTRNEVHHEETVTQATTLKELERREIISALARNGWIQARAARELGLTQRQIGYKIKKYNIKFPWEYEN